MAAKRYAIEGIAGRKSEFFANSHRDPLCICLEPPSQILCHSDLYR